MPYPSRCRTHPTLPQSHQAPPATLPNLPSSPPLGIPGAYGVVTMPFGVREGINIFLGGFIPTENLRFRDDVLTFKVGGD